VCTIAAFGNNLDSGFRGKQKPQLFTREALIIGEHNTDCFL
jgi:hypothetical protein